MELFLHPIIGYRVWGLDNFYNLLSLFSTTRWEPYSKLVGACKNHFLIRYCNHHELPDIDEIPNINCTCGIYAWKTLFGTTNGIRDFLLHGGYIIGKVYLWGRVIEHERGYRGQYAYPHSFLYSQEIMRCAVCGRIRDFVRDNENGLIYPHCWKCNQITSFTSPSIYRKKVISDEKVFQILSDRYGVSIE